MGKLYLFGNGIIKNDGKPLTSYEYRENDEIIFEFVPFSVKGGKAVPYAVSVEIEDGDIKVASELISVIKWGNDYELRFMPLFIDTYMPPTALKQNSAPLDNGDITVTVYLDSKSRVSVEGPGIFYIHTVEKDITDPEIRMNVSGNNAVAVVTGNAGGENYLLILLISAGCKVLYENTADKIVYNQNNIKISRNLKDMRGRVLNQTLSFNGTKYVETERSYECTYEHKYTERLLPYALLEAIMAGDKKDAASFLDKNLDPDALKDFFGEIREITEPKFYDFSEDEVAVITGKGNNLTASVYKFVIENDLIVNIVEKDL